MAKAGLEDALFGVGGRTGYAVLDGAAWDGLAGFLTESGAEFTPVPSGELDPALAQVAPYLVTLHEDETVFDTIFAAAWGRGRGIFTASDGDMDDVRAHLRRLTYVTLEGGGTVLFRYYDPAVLDAFSAVATREQRAALTGGILDGFHYEADAGATLRSLEPPSPAGNAASPQEM